MDLTSFTQIGVAIALVIVVKMFLEFLKRQDDNFTEVIKNHLAHSNKTNDELKNSNLQLKNVIEKLLDFLKTK